jgi:O-succinylbenzoic acid--CoA ligase
MEVDAWLARAAAARPRHMALETPEGDWSYARLHEAARSGAGELLARGARPGDRVAIALPAGLAFAQALHACLLLGAVAVPVDLRLAAREQERILDGAIAVVSEPLGEAHDPGSPAVAPSHDLDAVAVVIHTSGTTAAPRPVELTYGNLLWSAIGSGVALGTGQDERWLCALTLAHVGGLSILVRAAIRGSTAIVHERFETDRVLHDLSARRATGISLVATTLARLLDEGLQRPADLRCALTGGGPVPAALVTRAQQAGVPVGLTYGLSQAASQVTTTPLAEIAHGLDEPGGASAGPPLFCTRVRIAPDDEILVRGPTVAAGALAADGWLHTGDLGGLDYRGRLLVTGRKVDTIVSGGENIAPAEVEAVLEAHPQVLEAAVLARSDPRWGEAVIAIVVPRPGAVLQPETLRAHCARALAPFKVPKQFELASEPLPRTASGKLLRRELR